jgi:hypothetical protein
MNFTHLAIGSTFASPDPSSHCGPDEAGTSLLAHPIIAATLHIQISIYRMGFCRLRGDFRTANNTRNLRVSRKQNDPSPRSRFGSSGRRFLRPAAFRGSLILIVLISASPKSRHDQHRKYRTPNMTILMDKILQDLVEEAYEDARLRRIGGFPDRDVVFAEALGDLESSGDAMRYLNSKGRIAWKATPDLRNYLNDLKLDAEADFRHEDD